MHITRRNMLELGVGAVAASALPFGARGQSEGQSEGTPFDGRTVIYLAQELAERPFKPPPGTPEALADLNHETYRQIRYRKTEAVWGTTPTRFSIELFPPGYLFRDLIDIAIVEDAQARPLIINDDSFEVPDPHLAPLLTQAGKFAGFRLHYPINRPDYRDEFAVFQGASYFHAVSEGQIYGLSARGLAIDVAEPKGEEFPLFRSFWIERPSSDASVIVVHALLDSEGVTGAYRFAIHPGWVTTMEVTATLFPRRRLPHVGLAPLTSMFLHGPTDPPYIEDYRPAVHDSSVLAMRRGNGEALVRPLINPTALQIASFVDENPQAFGLLQRNRDFGNFQDLQADYGRRPSAWVEPAGEWGPGHVKLVEIPSNSEVNDNIVAYWRPARTLEPGQMFEFGYRLTWPNQAPRTALPARVVRTARGRRLSDRLPQMTIDWETDLRAEELTLIPSANPSSVREALLVNNHHTGGVRGFITFDPGRESLIELRAELRRGDEPVGETWLFRWLPE